MKRIAVEEAFVTREISDEWEKVLKSNYVAFGFREMGKTIPGDNPGTQKPHCHLLDLGASQIAHMDTKGIDTQVLSLTYPGVQVFNAFTVSKRYSKQK